MKNYRVNKKHYPFNDNRNESKTFAFISDKHFKNITQQPVLKVNPFYDSQGY